MLRGLDTGLVDLVYLDPPFNSNRTYSAPVGSEAAGAAFQDTWTLSDLDVAEVGLLADTEPALAEMIRAARLVHGNSMMSYLTMMAARLVELRRVMKPSGSIYLHCDDTASHYLKAMMDAIFGKENYRNEIIWKRTAGRSDARKFGRVHDTILYYAGDGATWNTQWMPHDPEYVKRAYRNEDELGRWQSDQLTASGPSGGESGRTWRGINPGGRHWSTPVQGGMHQFIIDNDLIPGWPDDYPGVHDRLDAIDDAGLVHWPASGMPRLKRYLASTSGTAVEDIFTDIGKLEASSKEKLGYPTQKPVALLERIIEASSNPGDLVLDPFAGCATTCDAAEGLGREWIGIDLSPKAAELMEKRLRDRHGLFGQVIHRTDLPRRGDLEPVPHYRTNARTLYGRQEGDCAGCGCHFEFRHLEVDHIVPQSKGGGDHLENLQMLCAHCNRVKGDRPMAALIAALADR